MLIKNLELSTQKMPSKIRVLSEHTINKIAAGEVIENPASVVKELVENSIDAKAKEICIEIKGGGRQMIRISDDGCGMNADDALLCLERHATSKIQEVEDIHAIATMGFRGEAIPSIASISKFTLLTCPQAELGTEKGTLIIVEGGKILTCTEAVRSPGTTIEVKSLFFNIPVRKKFQRSPAYDANEIIKIVSIMAMGNPEIKFQLINDGKTVLSSKSPSSQLFLDQLKESAAMALGADFLAGTCPIEAGKDGIHLQGLIGIPTYTRHNRTGQYLFINRRFILSPLISFAIKEGYGTYLGTGRHPVYVLHLSIPGTYVDVNVHPQKREVRLRQDLLIKELIMQEVRRTLSQRKEHFRPSVGTPMQEASPISFASRPFYLSADEFSLEKSPSEPHVESALPVESPRQSMAMQSSPELFPTMDQKPRPRVIGAIHGYVIVEDQFFTKRGFSLIDQRAAHSKIIYERLLKQSSVKESLDKLTLQTLLIPYTVELTMTDAEMLRKSKDEFDEMGIHFHECGINTFMVDAIPQMFGNVDIQYFLSEMLQEMRKFRETTLFNREKEKSIAMAATRACTSHERKLSLEEAQNLVNNLMDCQQPDFCPLGRPTMLHLSAEDLAKQFQKN